jgi:hypothetical protein
MSMLDNAFFVEIISESLEWLSGLNNFQENNFGK